MGPMAEFMVQMIVYSETMIFLKNQRCRFGRLSGLFDSKIMILGGLIYESYSVSGQEFHYANAHGMKQILVYGQIT